jgi:hypothetical protein
MNSLYLVLACFCVVYVFFLKCTYHNLKFNVLWKHVHVLPQWVDIEIQPFKQALMKEFLFRACKIL